VDLFDCGGTVIDAYHVVTAAHCVCYANSSVIMEDEYYDYVGKTIYVGNRIPAKLADEKKAEWPEVNSMIRGTLNG
jgi:hypothetical protein